MKKSEILLYYREGCEKKLGHEVEILYFLPVLISTKTFLYAVFCTVLMPSHNAFKEGPFFKKNNNIYGGVPKAVLIDWRDRIGLWELLWLKSFPFCGVQIWAMGKCRQPSLFFRWPWCLHLTLLFLTLKCLFEPGTHQRVWAKLRLKQGTGGGDSETHTGSEKAYYPEDLECVGLLTDNQKSLHRNRTCLLVCN